MGNSIFRVVLLNIDVGFPFPYCRVRFSDQFNHPIVDCIVPVLQPTILTMLCFKYSVPFVEVSDAPLFSQITDFLAHFEQQATTRVTLLTFVRDRNHLLVKNTLSFHEYDFKKRRTLYEIATFLIIILSQQNHQEVISNDQGTPPLTFNHFNSPST